jgi:hypothetical protein
MTRSNDSNFCDLDTLLSPLYGYVIVFKIPLVAVPSVPALIRMGDYLTETARSSAGIKFVYATVFD